LQLHIGGNLKRLRRERDLTQEELAAFLGVSFQAISKWERGEGYPDMETLPVIANYFGVTLDALVGMDALRDTAEAEALLEQSYRNSSDGKRAENIELLREGVRRFPGNWEIWSELAVNLHAAKAEDEIKKRNLSEAIEIFERLLDRCTDSGVRNRATANLCYAYDEADRRADAARLAGTLPGIWYCSIIKADFLDGEDKRHAIKNMVLHVTDVLDMQFYRLYNHGELTPDEKIELCRKSLTLLNTMFGEGELLHLAVNAAVPLRWLAEAYLEKGELETALEALEKIPPLAYEYDHQPEQFEYSSLLLRGLTFHREYYGKDYTESLSAAWVRYFDATERYDPVREHPRFIAFLERLRENDRA
jgi:transcriptional regulator with XRE-family HTH domain